jgi:hypothetical protein
MTIRVWLTNPIGWELPTTTGRGSTPDTELMKTTD